MFPSEKLARPLIYVRVYVNTHAHARPAGSACKSVILSKDIPFWITHSKGWRTSIAIS